MSSPEASPSSRVYASPSPPSSPEVKMTPRSKVKAFMAQFSDSDSDEAPKASKKKTVAETNVEDEDEDDDVPVVRQRARAVVVSDDDDVDMEDADVAKPAKQSAADRLRQTLFGKTAGESIDSDASNEEDDTPKQPRRRILKKKSSPVHSPGNGSPRQGSVTPQPESGDATVSKSKVQKKSKKNKDKAAKKSGKKSKKKAVSRKSDGSGADSLHSDSDDGSIGSLDSDDTPEALLGESNGESKLMQLVNQKKKANQAKEAIEDAKRKAREEAAREMQEELGMLSDISEPEGGKRSKATKKPSVRKASKKALFEMQAETQRMARNMNLKLQPVPKVEYPVSALWAVFGLENPNPPKEPEQPVTSGSSAPNTSEVDQSSPPSSINQSPKAKENAATAAATVVVDKENPFDIEGDMEMGGANVQAVNLVTELPIPKETVLLDKGKGKMMDEKVSTTDVPIKGELKFLSMKPKLGSLPKPQGSDSDSDDLEIIPPPKKTPPKNSADPMKDLKRLARLNSPEKRRQGRFGTNGQPTTDWLSELQQKARDQIKADEEERKDALRAQGIYIPTEEEKIQDALVIEDLVEKARQEAIEQKARERRQEAKEKGVRLADLSEDSDEDDGDWLGSGEDADDIEISGSEESGSGSEGPEDEDMEMDEDQAESGIPESAQRPSSPIRLSDMPHLIESDDEGAENSTTAAAANLRRQRVRAVVSDDEDESPAQESITQVPSSMQSPQKARLFANTTAAPLPIGLTQMFNSTEESNVEVPSTQAAPDHVPFAGSKPQAPLMGLTQMFESSMDTQVKNVPFAGLKPQAPLMGLTQMFDASMESQGGDQMAQNRMDALRGDIPEDLDISQIPLEPGMRNSQAETQGAILDLNYSQSQVQYEPESIMQPMFDMSTQASDYPDPTPDPGFQYNPAAAPPRFLARTDTMDSTSSFTKASVQSGLTEPTVILSPEPETRKARKGRLVRKNRAESETADGNEADTDDSDSVTSVSEEPTNAFNILGKKAKKQVEAYDKKKSEAKGLFQEAAEESEDEYAGLGGNSDDDEDDEDMSELEDLIDNETKDNDDRKHAEYYMKKSLADDEKNVQKLMKDITNGNLRKRRGEGFDLSDDSDDDRDRRERRRRKNEAERRALLMQHDNISQIANNPKRQAFLNVIDGSKDEERGFLDDEQDFDFAVHESSAQTDSQPVESVPDSQPNTTAAAAEVAPVESVNPRRTGKKRKTQTQLEVRRSVSSLLDDGISHVQDGQSSDSDLEIEGLNNMNKRRKVNVIDRMALKRSATTTSESAKMAFYEGGKTDPSGQFKVPALLRRATTQVTGETTTAAPRAAFNETTTSMKKPKAVGASINFQSREAAKQKNLEKAENNRKKEEKKVMGARRANAASVFNAGGFS